MEIMPRERLAQEKRDAKAKMEERLGVVYKTFCAATIVSRGKFAGSSSAWPYLL
jgi:DNA repair exonuclease SbcCD ATPase subunit